MYPFFMLMLPNIATSLTQIVVACGVCADTGLLAIMPFLGWWVLLFLGWSLLVGPLVFRFVNAANATDLKNPARLFLGFLGLLVVGAVITEGSFLLPFVLLAPFWIQALVRGIRCQCLGWRKFCITLVAVMALVVPVSYAFPVMKEKSPHGGRTSIPRATSAAPTTAPATTPPTSPTLQDALPVPQQRAP